MCTASISQKVRHVPLIWKINIRRAAKNWTSAALYTLGIKWHHSIISQKPPLSAPTRRRYLFRMVLILLPIAVTLIPIDSANSYWGIYWSPAIKRNMAILFSVNLSPFSIAFSTNFSTNPYEFSTNFSVTLGTETFKIKSLTWKKCFEINC